MARRLLYASHESLRDDYQVSCAELDTIVSEARATRGVYGCRMTGAGFGGCCIAIINDQAINERQDRLARNYTPRFHLDPQLLVTRPSRGADVKVL